LEWVAECETSRPIVLASVLITMAAALIATVAAFRVVQLGRRFDDGNGEELSRALVVHGVAVVVLAAAVLIAGWLPWAIAALGGAMAISWGATAILVGRRYDPTLGQEERERALEEARRDERRPRPEPVAKRFGPSPRRPEPQRPVAGTRRRADDDK
jgi:hypothetical protein